MRGATLAAQLVYKNETKDLPSIAALKFDPISREEYDACFDIDFRKAGQTHISDGSKILAVCVGESQGLLFNDDSETCIDFMEEAILLIPPKTKDGKYERIGLINFNHVKKAFAEADEMIFHIV